MAKWGGWLRPAFLEKDLERDGKRLRGEKGEEGEKGQTQEQRFKNLWGRGNTFF